MKKVFIALPLSKYGKVNSETDETIVRIVSGKNYAVDMNEYKELRGSPNIYAQRNNLAKMFLATDSDYYLYLDDDHVIMQEKNPLDNWVLWDKDIISPVIVRKVFPHIPCCMSKEKYNHIRFSNDASYFDDFREYEENPLEVNFSCGGFTLIKREVIESTKDIFFPLTEKGKLYGVDYSMMMRAKKKGFRCWVDTKAKVGHIGKYYFLPDDYYSLLDGGHIKCTKQKDGEYLYEFK